MDFVVLLHSRLAITTVLFMFALGAWATWQFMRGEGIIASYWGAVIIGEIVTLVQGALGVFLAVTGQLPRDPLHFLYGVLVALSFPAVYVYTRGRTDRAEAGWYALAGFFVFGLAIRAIMTGQR